MLWSCFNWSRLTAGNHSEQGKIMEAGWRGYAALALCRWQYFTMWRFPASRPDDSNSLKVVILIYSVVCPAGDIALVLCQRCAPA